MKLFLFGILVICLIFTVSLLNKATNTQSNAASVNTLAPESGVLTGNVSIGNDPNAPGGKYIKFGNVASMYFYGINEHPQWIRAQDMSQLVGYMAAAGIQSVRIDMSWNSIEPVTKGAYDFTNRIPRFDAFIAQCAAHNIEVVAILLDTPGWAVGSKTSPATNSSRVVPPDDLNATGYQGGPGSQNYNDYIGFVMDRWGIHGKSSSGTKWINHWEVWNEPNGYWAWSEATGTKSVYGEGKPDPMKYVWLLKGAYTKIKQVDKTALVLAPSISGANYIEWTDTEHFNWLDFVYSQGIKNYFDIFDAHYYGNGTDGQTYATPLDQVLALHAKYTVPIMAKYGDQNKRVWITETGVPGYGNGIPSLGVQSAVTQATALTTAYKYARTQMFTVDRLFWYTFTGGDTGTSDQDYFGIVGSPYPNGLADPWPMKPAYNALKAIPK